MSKKLPCQFLNVTTALYVFEFYTKGDHQFCPSICLCTQINLRKLAKRCVTKLKIYMWHTWSWLPRLNNGHKKLKNTQKSAFVTPKWVKSNARRKRKNMKKGQWKQWLTSLPSATMGGARKPPGPVWSIFSTLIYKTSCTKQNFWYKTF